MPKPQTPSKVIEAARKLLRAEGLLFGNDAQKRVAAALDAYAAERIAIMQTALDSHCETIKELAGERDAALARAEAAEADRDSWKATAEELSNRRLPTALEQRAEMRATLAEERVQAMEATLEPLIAVVADWWPGHLNDCPACRSASKRCDCGHTPIQAALTVARAALAKAAADPSEGGKE